MNQTIDLINRKIGKGQPCYIIAEMSANHAGDKGRAIEIIHSAKAAGADCIKIQTYTPDTMTIDCQNDFFKIQHGLWKGEYLYQLYKKAYTPWSWQLELKKEAEIAGLDFLSTPFDKSSVDFLESIGIKFYKIASFELTDIPLIKYISSKMKPVILSTGMGSLGEIEEAVNTVKSYGSGNLCILKCSSAYPAIPSDMNVITIPHLQETFGVPAGLSDHSLGSIGAIAAVLLGAKVIEKHFCLSRKIKTPDSPFSMIPSEFKRMVQDIRTAEKAIGELSYRPSNNESENKLFRRSVFAIKDIAIGELFTEDNIRVIRPAHGLEPKYYEDIVGKHAGMNIERGTPIKWCMVK